MFERTAATVLLEAQGFEVLAHTHGGVIPGSWADGRVLGITDGTLHAAREEGTGQVDLFFFPLDGSDPQRLLGTSILQIENRGKALNMAIEMVILPSDGELELVTFLGPTQSMEAILSALGRSPDPMPIHKKHHGLLRGFLTRLSGPRS